MLFTRLSLLRDAPAEVSVDPLYCHYCVLFVLRTQSVCLDMAPVMLQS